MEADTEHPESVACSVDDRGVATVRLQRPEKHNAFDDDMIARLREHFDRLAADPAVRVVILAAAGRSFSAGGDLAWMQRMADYDYADNLNDARALAAMLRSLKQLPQPSIACVQGGAFGGAVGLICCCDIAIGADTARFGLTETRVGLLPATIGPYVIEALGPRWTRRLFLTAERIDAQRAAQIGLLHEYCPAEQLSDRVEAVVGELLANGPTAMREAKKLCADLTYRAVDEAIIEDTSARIARLRVGDEGQEGLNAFLDKRAPPWTGGDKTRV
ncbi:MAG: enoyl-CoA hydratase/isomerase family protein [Halieaceae bacterium]|jgi:methylglutaconyl-CoA hydratase|nr:enoyl-CoA hydratase/isomerase family protein [Halieaceae bacterium]